MRRIFVDPSAVQGEQVVLEDDAFHHAAQVLRLKKGEQFQILFGEPVMKTVEVESLEKKRLVGRVVSEKALPELPRPYISLAISMPRFSTLEWIVEKSVELGVHTVQPLFSEFSFIKSAKEFSPSKVERLDRIIRSATEQTVRGDLMKVSPAMDLKEWAQQLTKGAGTNRSAPIPCLFAYERAEAPLDGADARQAAGSDDPATVRSHLQIFKRTSPLELWTLVGSEGGFSLSEVKWLSELGIPPLSLGPQILRAETACLATISILKYEFDLV